MHKNFISRHFSNQSGIITVLVNWPRAPCGVLQLTEASYLGPDSPRTSPRNETVKQCRRQMTVTNSPVQWPSWMPKMMKPFLTQFSSNLETALFCLHSSAHSSGCIDIILFREPRATALFWLLPNRGGWSSIDSGSLFDSWATSVLVGFNMDQAGGSDWRKNKV